VRQAGKKSAAAIDPQQLLFFDVVVVLRFLGVELALELDPLTQFAQVALDRRLLRLGDMRRSDACVRIEPAGTLAFDL